jgi:hypothetical protein
MDHTKVELQVNVVISDGSFHVKLSDEGTLVA